ncbi:MULTISPECIES: winged helix-turn-helix domain-containing protein [Pseudomonadati]|uniref:Winged helix-turn-helix domain-containing protein n=1 Tax=Shewanella aestuarii TaxID=1028752 RepID=A0ABT0KZ94_9GAMM|nr:winged helix-turn-helix domain-containing protein [Shewanella aestuarii]MCL1116784.1 winged helix-turn-helix domain-containing protein [Shewanella aestuarii]GGN73271.1 transcriptional regulator [Shewanella aestuarii]
MSKQHFFFGPWQVNPTSNSLQLGSDIKQIEPKAMQVLQLLCQHSGEVLSPDEIVEQCWGHTVIGDNPLHKIITQLRKALGDSASKPEFIETIRKRGYRTLAEVNFPLIELDEHIEQHTWQGGSPFPGLRAFDAKDADVFYGRTEQISTLLKRMSKQVQFGRAFCLLLGPSGSGKSSLLNAGVVPQFMRPQGFDGIRIVSHTSLDLADISQDRLFTDIALAMLDLDINDIPVFEGMTAQSLADLLQQDMPEVIKQAQQALASIQLTDAAYTPKLSLFIDRLEVLLSSPLFTEPEIQTALDIIESLATSGCFMLFSACRNDFYPQVVSRPSLMAGKANGSHFDLAPPSRTELLQMIRLPAKAAGLKWDTDPQTSSPLDELLCSEAANNPDALPMLQYTLQELYLQRDDNDTLLVSVYQKLGGIEGAIGQKAEGIFAALAAKHQHCLSKVLSLLVTLSADETNITSRAARWSQLSDDNETALVQTLVDNRLFVSHLQNGQGCFSVAHEALLRRWPRVLQWIEAHRDSLRVNSRLVILSQRWLDEQQQSAYLLTEGKPLQEALALVHNPLFNLDTEQHAFIQASKKSAGLKRLAKMSTIAILCLLTVLSVFMTVRSTEAEHRAQEKRLAAENLLGFMVGEFADKMRSIGRMDLLDGISNKALEYFSNFSNADDARHLSFEARFQHGQTLEAMGEVAYSRGNTEEAKSALLAAREKMLPLVDLQANNLSLLKTLGANAFWLGQLEYDKSDWQATLPWFELYLQYSQTMYQYAPTNFDAVMELSYAHNSIGSAYMEQQNFNAARQAFEHSLELKLSLLKQDESNSQLIADVANTHSWLASAATSQGDVPTAINIHTEIQMLLTRLAGEKQPYILDRLSSSYLLLARLLIFQDDVGRANEKMHQAIKTINKAIKQDPDNDMWITQQSMIYIDMLKNASTIIDKSTPHSINALAKMLTDDQVLSSSTKKQELWALYELAAAQYLMHTGAVEESLTYAETATHSFNELVIQFDQKSSYKSKLAESQVSQAAILSQLNQPEQAKLLCRKTIDLLSKLVATTNDPEYLVPYARALDCIDELTLYPQILQQLQNSAITNYQFTH